jgi:hypothetical protein
MRTIHAFEVFHPNGRLIFYSKSRLVSFRGRLYDSEESYAALSLVRANLAAAVSRRASVFMLPFFFNHSAIVKCSVRWSAGDTFEGFVFFLNTSARVRGVLVEEGVHILLTRLQRWFHRTAAVLRRRRQDAALAFAMSGHVRLGCASCAGGLGSDALGVVLQKVLRP